MMIVIAGGEERCGRIGVSRLMRDQYQLVYTFVGPGMPTTASTSPLILSDNPSQTAWKNSSFPLILTVYCTFDTIMKNNILYH